MQVVGIAALVMLFVGAPLWVIADVALDVRDKRRGVDRTRFSFGKYLFAILVLTVLSGAYYIVF